MLDCVGRKGNPTTLLVGIEAMIGFIFLGSKISHGIKRCLLIGRKAMTNLDSILKIRDIILPTRSL